MGNVTKERAVGLVFQDLARFFDPASVTIATLGGEGHERRAWARLGIPLDHCWFIERDRVRSARLIHGARAAHHFHGELRDFPRAFRAVVPGGGLDVFHWDLSGTVEPSADELRPVLPLVAGSAGRCLLVSCADARDNRGIREADLVDAWWQWLLGGDRDRAFRSTLTREQDIARFRKWTEAEAANVVSRERSALLTLLLVLADLRVADGGVRTGRAYALKALERTRRYAEIGQSIGDVSRTFYAGEPRVAFLPDAAVRVVYPSRNHAMRPGFRMRTIGLHLEHCTAPVPLREAAAWLVQIIMDTPLQLIVPGSGGRFRSVKVRGRMQREPRASERAQQQEEQTVEATSSGTVNLRDLVAARAKELKEQARTLGVEANGRIDVFVNAANDALVQLDLFAGQLGEILAAEDRVAAARQRQEELRRELASGTAVVSLAAAPSDTHAPELPAPTVAEPVSPAAPPQARRLTKNARREIYRRFVAAAQRGAAALRVEYDALKGEFGPGSYRMLQSYLRNARRHGGKRGAATPTAPAAGAPKKPGPKPMAKPAQPFTVSECDDIRLTCDLALAEGQAQYEKACRDIAASRGCAVAYVDVVARRGRGKFATEFAVRYCARIGRLHHRVQAARKLAAALAKHPTPVQIDVQQLLKTATAHRKQNS